MVVESEVLKAQNSATLLVDMVPLLNMLELSTCTLMLPSTFIMIL